MWRSFLDSHSVPETVGKPDEISREFSARRSTAGGGNLKNNHVVAKVSVGASPGRRAVPVPLGLATRRSRDAIKTPNGGNGPFIAPQKSP